MYLILGIIFIAIILISSFSLPIAEWVHKHKEEKNEYKSQTAYWNQ
jgi:hypothetical protein